MNIDFILNFGRYIKKKAWSKENFDQTLNDISLSAYYVLLLDDTDTVGILVAFTIMNRKFYAYLNNDPKYIKISNLQKILMDKEKLESLKKFNVMDLKHQYRLIQFDNKQNKTILNQNIHNNIHTIDTNDYDPNKKYIINAECVGRHIILVEKERLYPVYFLNQNYIRFNHAVINIDFLKQFLQQQHFRFNLFIIDPTIQLNKI